MWVTPVDNSVHPGDKSWATPIPGAIALLGLGVVLGVAAAASYTEPPAAVFIGIAAVAVAVIGLLALVRRPRLVLGSGPVLNVRTLSQQLTLTPAEIESIELLGTRRLAFRSTQLLVELESGRLLVFGQWDLGTNPRHVADDLAAAGFPLRDRTNSGGDSDAQRGS